MIVIVILVIKHMTPDKAFQRGRDGATVAPEHDVRHDLFAPINTNTICPCQNFVAIVSSQHLTLARLLSEQTLVRLPRLHFSLRFLHETGTPPDPSWETAAPGAFGSCTDRTVVGASLLKIAGRRHGMCEKDDQGGPGCHRAPASHEWPYPSKLSRDLAMARASIP